MTECPQRKRGFAEFERIRIYLGDERHIYKGPRHRRRQSALEDLHTIETAMLEDRVTIADLKQQLNDAQARKRIAEYQNTELREQIADLKRELEDYKIVRIAHGGGETTMLVGELIQAWERACDRVKEQDKQIADLKRQLRRYSWTNSGD